MVGGHTGAGLDEIKLLAVSLSKSQSRQSPHCLFCCSLLPLHQCLHFNGNWNNSHTLSPDAAHSEALTKACKDTLGGVTAGIQLENSGPHSAPTSVLLLDYLRLYWLFYHIKDRCQQGWIYDVCHNQPFDNAVWLQNRFWISHPLNLSLWSYKTGHISLENLCWENPDYVSMWKKNAVHVLCVI